MKKAITSFFLFAIINMINGQNAIVDKTKSLVQKDTVKKSKLFFEKQDNSTDTLFVENVKYKPYKKNAHASYYAEKFQGRKTASGKLFDMNKLTAAHKKLPFGTKLKVTNEANGKSVIVEITDRGPFVKSREIDLSKRAFMEIAKNKAGGALIVTLELVLK